MGGAPAQGRSAHRKVILPPGAGQSDRSTCERAGYAAGPTPSLGTGERGARLPPQEGQTCALARRAERPRRLAPAPPYCAVSARRDSSERPSGAPDRAHSKRLTRLLAVPVRPRAELAEVADDLAVLRLEGAVLADLREVAAAGPAVDRALAVEGPDGVGARAGVDPGRPGAGG